MIKMQEVSKQYDNGIWALKKISLEIKNGEFVYIVGPSGSGKSTLMKLMNLQERMTSGSLQIDSYDLNKIKDREIPFLRRRVAVVFQDFRLLPTYTVGENIAYALEVTGKSRKEINKRVKEVLEIVGLPAKRHQLPAELSGGEQQRVAIARALANHPKILLADEPTGNLDPRSALEIMHALERVNQQGTTVLMGTHNDGLVNSHPHRILLMNQGKLVRDIPKGGIQHAGRA